MKKPDTPHDERVRLETLRALNILDTEAEERFDRLTRMAKRLFDVPIALVSLVDENRQWFKSCIGLEVSETPRDVSFCGHAILGNDPFIISDTAEDERFADNPLVLNDPYIRFYAGCPLFAPNGKKLGTLCIIDRRPRNFSENDLEGLVDLAAMVEREIAAVQMATVDELTDISNRRGFMLLAQHSLNLCARYGLPATLVFIDLDGFKKINDTFGHSEGDRALADFAENLRDVCRDADIFARLGGDEFVLLLADANKEMASRVVDRLYSRVEELNKGITRGYQFSFSHGVVAFDKDKNPEISDMLSVADSIMYRLKKSKQ